MSEIGCISLKKTSPGNFGGGMKRRVLNRKRKMAKVIGKIRIQALAKAILF